MGSQLVAVLDFALRSSEQTGSSGGNKTSLLPWNGLSANTRTMADMGMVTTTMGMVDGVHIHTRNLGPARSSDLMFVIGDSGLHDWLLSPSAASDNADHGSRVATNGFPGS